jgi:hypothetical protein
MAGWLLRILRRRCLVSGIAELRINEHLAVPSNYELAPPDRGSWSAHENRVMDMVVSGQH